ncbi:DUF1707 SHOCT-like domain-containing protein [Streptomyces sp. 8L]|uniref:DUF1707 SHOCT-like domain-containing protein n=1 Tax=Streptomyces sp. 8L TaxID=2877242 RepID=UPI0021E612E9|nr:DUF1707 domain-containing protein [Streptomyces sp. 8L]
MTSEPPERRTDSHVPESRAPGSRVPGGQASGTRASDAEREQIAERLREAVAEGRLDMEEFDERLGLAYQARTRGELVPLVSDLPEPGTAEGAGPAASALGTAPDAGVWAGRVGSGPGTSRSAFGILGGFGRKGNWTVGRKFHATAFMGGGEIDLREARFEEPVTVIRCFAFMGGVQVTAPPELDIEVRGFGFMGGFGESPAKREAAGISPDPDSPKVIVTGFALMGGVGVERKLRKEERRRLKEERKRLAAGGETGSRPGRDDRYEAVFEAYEDRMARHEERRARQEDRREERRARHEELRERQRDRRDDHRDRRRGGDGRGDRRGDGFRKEL